MSRFVLVVAFAVLVAPCAADAAVVRMQTIFGNIDVMLLMDEAPITCDNFLRYVNEGLYDNSIFHRSMPGFVIQGGGLNLADPQSGYLVASIPTYPPIVNEFSFERSNVFGTVAMAKLPYDANTGTGGPDSATSQFFFNLADNSQNLDYQNGGFTVFGYIVDGIEVAQAIEDMNTWNFGSPFDSLPVMDTYTLQDYYSYYLPYQSELAAIQVAFLLADANNDGNVDAADYMTLKRNFGMAEGATWGDGDFDGDGDVDYYDKYLLEFSLGQMSDYSPPSVPEPGTMLLLAAGAAAVLRRRRTRRG